MVGPIDGGYQSKQTAKANGNFNTEETKTSAQEGKPCTSYRGIYNESKGNEAIFTKKVIQQFKYSENDAQDLETISQIFGFLKTSDVNDGDDGNISTSQLLNDLEEKKLDVEHKLNLSLEHEFGVDPVTYFNFGTDEEAKEKYLRDCLSDNAGFSGADLEEKLTEAKLTIQSSLGEMDILNSGINQTLSQHLREQINEDN